MSLPERGGRADAASTYEKGRSLLREKRYVEALKVFRGLMPDYRDVRQIIQILEKNLQSEAESHYKTGLSTTVPAISTRRSRSGRRRCA